MAQHRITVWVETILRDDREYLVEAPSSRAAARKLRAALEAASATGQWVHIDTALPLEGVYERGAEDHHIITPFEPTAVATTEREFFVADQIGCLRGLDWTGEDQEDEETASA